ncbi:NOL1/NOP2/sun family putative RNA methylase, partial [Candidatus Woesearchaeota archaeon]|nr:NOL1/NOP2/sun family putative RNA methylase [Candidatus Woesearchaeota archaeon]
QPKEDDLVLDLCASPGSKTTQAAAMMKNKGLIIANDNQISRLKPLQINLQRCGVTNTVITLMEGRWFKNYPRKFDKIMVDAPCSGIGTIRKSPQTVQWWNPNFIKQMAGIQKQLLESAFGLLNEGGVLVYSTCTLEPEENEGVVDYLIGSYDNAKVENIHLEIKKSEPVSEFEGKTYSPEVKKCLRIWPQDNDTEGFFVAKIRKS